MRQMDDRRGEKCCFSILLATFFASFFLELLKWAHFQVGNSVRTARGCIERLRTCVCVDKAKRTTKTPHKLCRVCEIIEASNMNKGSKTTRTRSMESTLFCVVLNGVHTHPYNCTRSQNEARCECNCACVRRVYEWASNRDGESVYKNTSWYVKILKIGVTCRLCHSHVNRWHGCVFRFVLSSFYFGWFLLLYWWTAQLHSFEDGKSKQCSIE